MIKAKVVGACGFGGVGIIELLRQHPKAEVSAIVDIENNGRTMGEVFPHLAGFCDLPILPPDDPAAQSGYDVVFMATPDRTGMNLAPAEVGQGAKVVDYSGDFRFNNEEAYADYAGRIGLDPVHACPELLARSAYGLPELQKNSINSKAQIVGNPGCFAVSSTLGLAPAVKGGLISLDGIICDCKTGVSGAGRKPKETFHYPARYDNMNAYRLSGHQHVCEIERGLGTLAGNSVNITFTAQVVPLCRGIMSTVYGKLRNDTSPEDAFGVYAEFYKKEPFVRVYNAASQVGTVHVRGTNFCNLVVSVDERTAQLRVVSYIDNLVKGQAGNALQNMNILFGLEETTGLDKPGIYP